MILASPGGTARQRVLRCSSPPALCPPVQASSRSMGPRCGNSIADQLTSSADRFASSPRCLPLRTLIETGTPCPNLCPAGALCLPAQFGQCMCSQSHSPIAYLPAANHTPPPVTSLTACVCPDVTASAGCGRRQCGSIGEENGQIVAISDFVSFLFLTLLVRQLAVPTRAARGRGCCRLTSRDMSLFRPRDVTTGREPEEERERDQEAPALETGGPDG